MDYRFANTSDIPALTDAVGGLLAGEACPDAQSAEKRWWERFGDDRRTVIFEDEGKLVAHLVYRPSKEGFELEEFATSGGGLIAAEALRLLLDEILAPTTKVVVSSPAETPEAVQFWRARGFEADRVTLAMSDRARRAAASEG